MSQHNIAADKTLLTATIAISASLSDGVYLGDAQLCAIKMPAAWTTGGLSLQTSLDGVAYNNVFTSSGEYTIGAAAGSWITLDPTYIKGLGTYIKVRSGTSGSPVVQEAARTIGLYVREF